MRALSFLTLYCFSSVSLNYVVIKHNNNKMETEIGACVHLKSERNNKIIIMLMNVQKIKIIWDDRNLKHVTQKGKKQIRNDTRTNINIRFFSQSL